MASGSYSDVQPRAAMESQKAVTAYFSSKQAVTAFRQQSRDVDSISHSAWKNKSKKLHVMIHKKEDFEVLFHLSHSQIL